MSCVGVEFESVSCHDWEHLNVCEEAFRKRHEEELLKFGREVRGLRDEHQMRLIMCAQSSTTKVRWEEEQLEKSLRAMEKGTREMMDWRECCEKVRGGTLRLKQTCEELNERLVCIERKEEQLLEQKSLFDSEVMETHNAFLMARGYYRDNLQMHYSVDMEPESSDMIVNIKYFTTKKRSINKESKYSIAIQINNKDHTAKLLNTNPKLSISKELNERLMESGDCMGLICCIRKCFVKLHAKE